MNFRLAHWIMRRRGAVTLSFVLSAGMGALAGCVVSPITYVQYDSGTGLYEPCRVSTSIREYVWCFIVHHDPPDTTPARR